VVVVMAYFKIPTIKTKPRKKISIDGLSEFQWNEIEAKVEIGSGSFNLLQFMAYKNRSQRMKCKRVKTPY
jgi:hypothetical protein